MIKLTKIKSKTESNTTVVFIPGGPGLSSSTLRTMDILSRSFNLCYVDFPGCNGNPYLGKKTFEELSDAIKKSIENVDGRIFLVGHSFGGFYASQVGINLDCNGIICLSVPFSEKTLNVIVQNYQTLKTKELSLAEEQWSKEPTDTSFAKWLSEYGLLYFSKQNLEQGRKLILEDQVCAQFFKDNRSVGNQMESLLQKLKLSSLRKLFIAGENDMLVSQSEARLDALNGGFDFSLVSNASHFTTFDQPESVARSIESFIATTKGTL